MSVYQLPSPPTQQPVSQLPYSGMTKPSTTDSIQMATPKENTISTLKTTTTTTTTITPATTPTNNPTTTPTTTPITTVPSNGNSKSNTSPLKAATKKKNSYVYNPLKIDTTVISNKTPVSPNSQSSSPQPSSATNVQSPRTKSSNNTTFVHKLYQMLSDPSQSNFINWNEKGLSFIIRNVQGFSQHVLPSYFRHNNFSSFVRQLNMYGFHKINKSSPNTKNNENQTWEFYHPKFIRGQPHLVEEIKRKQLDNENWRSNIILQEQSKFGLGRHASLLNKTSSSKRSSVSSLSNSSSSNPTSTTTSSSSNTKNISSSSTTSTSSTTTISTPSTIPATTVTSSITITPTIPSQNQLPMMNTPEIPCQTSAVYINGVDGTTTAAHAVTTTTGETVIIDPASIHNTPNMQMVQNVPVGVMPVPAPQQATGTPLNQPITMGNTMGNVIPQNPPNPQNPQAMVDPSHIVMEGHTILPEVQQVQPVSSMQPIPNQFDNDIYYNIQLLQMQNQDMNQRINELQMNVNNLMNTYSRRMDIQQNMIQQLMNSAQQQQQQQQQHQQPQPQPQPLNNVTTVCSVDQGQTITSNFENQMLSQGTTLLTQSPLTHGQLLHQSPAQGAQMMVPQNNFTASPEQEMMNQAAYNQNIKHEGLDQFQPLPYPTQTIYY